MKLSLIFVVTAIAGSACNAASPNKHPYNNELNQAYHNYVRSRPGQVQPRHQSNQAQANPVNQHGSAQHQHQQHQNPNPPPPGYNPPFAWDPQKQSSLHSNSQSHDGGHGSAPSHHNHHPANAYPSPAQLHQHGRHSGSEIPPRDEQHTERKLQRRKALRRPPGAEVPQRRAQRHAQQPVHPPPPHHVPEVPKIVTTFSPSQSSGSKRPVSEVSPLSRPVSRLLGEEVSPMHPISDDEGWRKFAK